MEDGQERYSHDFELRIAVYSNERDVRKLTKDEVINAVLLRLENGVNIGDINYEETFDYETSDYFDSTKED